MYVFVVAGKVEVGMRLPKDDMPQGHGCGAFSKQVMLEEPLHDSAPKLDHTSNYLYPTACEQGQQAEEQSHQRDGAGPKIAEENEEPTHAAMLQ